MRRALPTHVGFIPDGNRRGAVARGYEKQAGYEFGIAPGVAAINECIRLGIPEISICGFTQDNAKMPTAQVTAFRDAWVEFAHAAFSCDVALLVVGNDRSTVFPDELRPFLTRTGEGMKVNLLINYGWEWDLAGLKTDGAIRSHLLRRMDLVIRWGGGRRLSGFLPVQSVYADIFVVDEYGPDFRPSHLQGAIEWFKEQRPNTWRIKRPSVTAQKGISSARP